MRPFFFFSLRDSMHAHPRHAGRHGHRGGHGYHGHRGSHSDGFGFDELRRGRKLNSGDLQLLLLALLAEKPSHGYELIKSLDERSNGYYVPSPGMIYPALTYLDEIGYATVAPEGAKKLYSITPAGLAHIEEQRARVDDLLEQFARFGRSIDAMRRAVAGDAAADAGDDFDERWPASGSQGGRATEAILALRRARRSLKSAIIERFHSGPDEQLRIARILERAAAAIRGENRGEAGGE